MAKKFDFLSPGIEMREIDQSFLPVERDAEGPIIIGRTRKGPANKPVKIKNLDDFVSVFGAPIPGGTGPQGDIWREGNTIAPTYASYAAQAWLASEESPVVVIRLAGEQHPSATSDGKAGWKLSGSIASAAADNSSAYGLFVIQSASAGTVDISGSLAAVFYANRGYLTLKGTDPTELVAGTVDSKACNFITNGGTNCEFQLEVYDHDGTKTEARSFSFDRNSSKYIRTIFNTNPQSVNETLVSTANRKSYWLGESYVRELEDLNLMNLTANKVYGVLLPLESGSVNWSDRQESAKAAKSGYVISQKDTGQKELFRLVSHHVGSDVQANYMVSVEDIRTPTNPNVDSYGTFTICVKDLSGQTVERFSNLNFNAASPNYIAKRIGDQYLEWDNSDRRYRTYGNYPNNSDYVYVEVTDTVRDGAAAGELPAGFKGPVRPKGFTLSYGSVGAQTLGDAVNTGTKANRALNFIDAMSTGDNIVFTHPDLGAHTINFVASSGVADTVFNTSRIAEIHPATDNDSQKTATAVAALLNSLDGYDATRTATGRVEITASVAGPHFNVVVTDADAATKCFITASVAGTDTDDFAGVFAKGNASVPGTGADADVFVNMPVMHTCSFQFPSISLRANGTDGGSPDPYRAYYGIRPKLSNTSTVNNPDYVDYVRGLPVGADPHIPGKDYEYSFVFTLDDLIVKTAGNTVQYVSGAHGRAANGSYTANTGSFGDLLDLNVRQFLMPLFGGTEGVDITEKDPFRNALIGSTAAETTNYVQYTLNKALDSVRDPEVVPANLLVMPGINAPLITNKMINIAEDRKDMLAIIDIENDYVPVIERLAGATENASLGNVGNAVTTFKGRNLNSSYACAFYPYVQLSDNINNGQLVWVPPSVAALGAFGKSQSQADVWFAPAGFNRGGLGTLGGPRGPQVVQARQRLDSNERDKLYEVNINPIATFPAEGLVIFGQKTLQAGSSALDRINVRRLLLYLKSEVSVVARNLLFDNNVPSTWARFTSQVNPILSDVKARFGLTDYKLVLDETTTTADLIDRNIMYAKIFIKPARAIEYIVVDFVITRTGADFV